MGARGSGGHSRVGPTKKGAEASLPDTTTDCTPPAGMSVEALAYWNHHAPLQAARGLLTQSGRFLLRRYCQIAALFDRVIAEQDRTEVLMLTSTVDGAGNEKIKAENNPLGARALYLGTTEYRIHGTNQPWTIGGAVSSGCIRMRNEDVVDLYERVNVGTTVEVI